MIETIIKPNKIDKMNACIEEFKKANHVLITSHLNPDGDAIGSELAVARWLKKEGKTVQIVNTSATPDMYVFLDPENEIQKYDPENPPELPEDALVCIVDVGVWERIGDFHTWLRATPNKKVCIDHHKSKEDIADINWVDTNAAATGEIVFQMLKNVGTEFNFEIALPLYTAIVIDTGNFRYSNTRTHSHIIAGELLKYGVEPTKVEAALNERNSWEKMRLTGRVLADLGKAGDGKIAWTKISLKLMEETGSNVDDQEGLVEMFRTIDGVEIGILLREMDPTTTKISLRSKGQYDMSKLANQFGGGGHAGAAGAVIPRSMDDLLPDLLEAAEKLIKNHS